MPVFLRDNQGEIIKRNKQAKRLEARYLAELHLPEAQLQGAREMALGDQVYSYAQIPLQLGKQSPAGISSRSPTSAPCVSAPACCARPSAACGH